MTKTLIVVNKVLTLNSNSDILTKTYKIVK